MQSAGVKLTVYFGMREKKKKIYQLKNLINTKTILR